jgi:hypothetical protein
VSAAHNLTHPRRSAACTSSPLADQLMNVVPRRHRGRLQASLRSARAQSSAALFAKPERSGPPRSPDGTACCSLPRLLGSETDPTVCEARVTQTHYRCLDRRGAFYCLWQMEPVR